MQPLHQSTQIMSPQNHTILTPSEAPIELSADLIEYLTREPVKIDNEALVGNSLRNHGDEHQSTIATLGETPFENHNGEGVEHHNIVGTEIFHCPIINLH